MNVSVYRDAQREGSGLRGLSVSLLEGDGTLLTNLTGEEAESADAQIEGIGSGDATAVVMKISASSPAPAVTGTFYRCGLHFH